MELGAFMAVREYECVLCGGLFSMMAGDLMPSEYLICDECVEELCALDDEALRERVAQQLAGHEQREWLEARIVHNFENRRQRESGLPE